MMKKQKNFIDSISLNEQQRKAVVHKKGPLLVIAGAGSGKTRVITARIAHLIIQNQVQPYAIIALTFTNKAANEMKERIATIIGKGVELPFVGTFHSYCVRLLKENAELVEAPFISILDEDDKKKLIGGILKRNNLHKQISARQASYRISQMKNKTIDITKPSHTLFDNPLMPDIFTAYEKEKEDSKCLDFDDLLLESVTLFKKNRSFKKQYQQKIKHILVDEYQDTNIVQHALLKQMSLSGKKSTLDSICAVGDEDQSIYSWRGATIKNILNFKKDFSGTKTIKIEQNYRSVQPILEVANKVIKHNKLRNHKNLWSDKPAKNRVTVLTCVSEYQEADSIVHLVNINKDHEKKDQIAVLYRTHAQSRAIEEALLKNSIPYKIIGGVQFYERKEIKDLLAYLKLIVNPFDHASFFRIVNTPARGLGNKFEDLFHTRWKQEPFLTFKQIAQALIDEKAVKGTKLVMLKQFIDAFESISPTDKPSESIEKIITKIKYITYIKNNYEKEDADTRLQNINELVNAMKHFELNKVDNITLFLEEVTLLQEKNIADDDQENKVLLMTLHAAKGLEFDIVILAGLEEGILPTSRALYEDDSALEEERRLFYVGITRAKERLIFTHTKFRYTYGQMVDQLSSQFLEELPQKLITNHDCSYWNSGQFRQFFADFLGIRHEIEISTPSFKERRKQFKSILAKKIKNSKISKKTETSSSDSEWKLNRPVSHKKYGTGLIQKVETKNCDKVITVKFKIGMKKIMSKFLQTV